MTSEILKITRVQVKIGKAESVHYRCNFRRVQRHVLEVVLLTRVDGVQVVQHRRAGGYVSLEPTSTSDKKKQVYLVDFLCRKYVNNQNDRYFFVQLQALRPD